MRAGVVEGEAHHRREDLCVCVCVCVCVRERERDARTSARAVSLASPFAAVLAVPYRQHPPKVPEDIAATHVENLKARPRLLPRMPLELRAIPWHGQCTPER